MTDALIDTCMRVNVLPDLANAIASVGLKTTSTSLMSRWFGTSTWQCEHSGSSAANAQDGVTLTQRRAPLCFVQVFATTVCASRRTLAWSLLAGRCSVLSRQVGCSLLCGAQSLLLVELFESSLPTDLRISRLDDGRLRGKMLLGVLSAICMQGPV